MQPRCPSADEWIRKLWYIYTMEYYSAIKKNSFESVLMRWMKLEPIILSEVSQKGKCLFMLPIFVPKAKPSIGELKIGRGWCFPLILVLLYLAFSCNNAQPVHYLSLKLGYQVKPFNSNGIISIFLSHFFIPINLIIHYFLAQFLGISQGSVFFLFR